MKRTPKLKRAGPLGLTAAAILPLFVFGCATVPVEDPLQFSGTDSQASVSEEVDSRAGATQPNSPDMSLVEPVQAPERPVPPGMLLLPVPLIEDGISTPPRPASAEREVSPEGLALPIVPPAATHTVVAGSGREDVSAEDSPIRMRSVPAIAAPAVESLVTDGIPASESVQHERDEPTMSDAPETARPAETSSAVRGAAIEVDSDADASDVATMGIVSGSESTELRRGYTASTEEVVVVLPGEGWLYVGREYGDGSVEFLGKQTVVGNDEFRFRLGSEGEYRLWFQQQDSRSGVVSNERLWLVAEDHVPSAELVVSELPAVDDAAVVGLQSGAEETGSGVAVGVDTREALEMADSAQAPSGDGSGEGVLVVDRDYWVGLASSGSADAGEARRRLQAMSLDGSGEEIDEALNLLTAFGEATPGDYSDSITALIENGELDRASGWTDRYLLSGTASRYGTDRLLYLLAQRLEEPGPKRDLRLSLYYYQLLMDRYPVSRYWEPSRERTEYLNRHYFEVR